MRPITREQLPYLLLAVAGMIEFLFITLEGQFMGLGYYLIENYLIVPGLLFLGYTLQKPLPEFSRRRFGFLVCDCPDCAQAVRHGEPSHDSRFFCIFDGVSVCGAGR